MVSSLQLLSPFSKTARKKKLLVKLAKSVINNERYKQEFQILMSMLNVDESEIIQTYLDYNLNTINHSEDIFLTKSISFVLHIQNLLDNSWHTDRQREFTELLNFSKAKNIVDIGFGVPSLYIKKGLLEKKSTFTLCDYSCYAISFAKHLLDLWDKSWHERVFLQQANMNEVEMVVGNYDLYLFLDSIEHALNPTDCLKKYVQSSAKTARFLISIPIWPLAHFHNIFWMSQEEGRRWIESCGLSISLGRKVEINPTVDLFASDITPKLYNYIVLCEKL